ncbi:MAG: hypothetical protein HY795_17720 [Desulfovibrio sp.]|nr:hypothetical protein [Desulfovibrio sp.]MBI4960987.1 hypothetical protein [Desulfovibrio sp.]
MISNRSAGYYALLAYAVFVLLLWDSPKTLAQECTPLPESDRYTVLAYLQAMHQGQYSRTGPSIKVFEVGGGDPAMNGSFIYLRIDHNDRSFVWNTGLNVRSVKRMSFGSGNAILLRVDEDFMNSNAAIVHRTATYRLLFYLDGGVLRNTVTLDGGVPGIKKE